MLSLASSQRGQIHQSWTGLPKRAQEGFALCVSSLIPQTVCRHCFDHATGKTTKCRKSYPIFFKAQWSFEDCWCPQSRIYFYFQPRNGHQQRFACGSQHRPPSNDGTFTLFIPSSEVVPGRLALLLAARCDSTSCGEQYQSALDMGSSLENGDDRGLLRTLVDAIMDLRRVNDSNLSPVGSSGVGSPTDAFNPTPIPRVVQQFGRVGVSSLPLHPLRFRATGPFFLIPKNYFSPLPRPFIFRGPSLRV